MLMTHTLIKIVGWWKRKMSQSHYYGWHDGSCWHIICLCRFSNLTLKFGYISVYIFYITYPEKAVWQVIWSQTKIFRIFYLRKYSRIVWSILPNNCNRETTAYINKPSLCSAPKPQFSNCLIAQIHQMPQFSNCLIAQMPQMLSITPRA